MFKSSLLGLLLAIGLQAPIKAAEPALYQPRAGAAAKPAAPRVPTPRAAVIEDGRLCTVIDFEGMGDAAAVPAVDGVSLPGWLAIIDADAGGSGNIAQEPSPDTVAFWLGGNPGARDIVLTDMAAKVEFHYASAVPVLVQALNELGLPLAIVLGPANVNQGTGDPNGEYNRWDPLTLTAAGNRIKTVRVTGNADQTAIDNVKVCRNIGVAAIEMTQAIQQFQTLDELKASLRARREPPVPVVAGKAGVLRVYMQKVDAVTDVTVRLTGPLSETRTVTLQPQCEPEDQRRQAKGCRSVDFYFTPPAGNWEAGVQVLGGADQVIETHVLPFRSRKTDTLNLRAVSVCDARSGNTWQCAPASALIGQTTLLRRLAPTSSLTLSVTNSFVRRRTSSYSDVAKWWQAASRDLQGLFKVYDAIADTAGEHRVYYGMVRTQVPPGLAGRAYAIPSRAALSRVATSHLGLDSTQAVIAHEVGHTLGLKHTATAQPMAAGGAAPGCYGLAKSKSSDWPFADNQVQSLARREVGFDVAARAPLDPDNTFDLLSYCLPRWISPLRYKRALTALDGGGVATPSALPAEAMAEEPAAPSPRAMVDGRFWLVSGTIEAGAAVFDPLFDDAPRGPDDEGEGEGSHRIEVRDAAGAVLFARPFTPDVHDPEGDPPLDDDGGPPAFSELLPFNPAAAAIAVLDPSGATLGELRLGGAAPAVELLQPLGGTLSGPQLIAWRAQDPDSAALSARVSYSPDNGATWSQLAMVEGEQSLLADFNALPGASGGALLRVVVSDGANTGSATSPPFSVPRKTPEGARIAHPLEGAVFAPAALVQLEGGAYDVDDGMLDGDAISWSSSLDGLLGSGAVLDVTTLRPGTHMITMRATDTDGNTVSAMRTVHVAGAAPGLQLLVTPLDTLPTSCVDASIVAQPDPGGVGLALAEYSLDGGLSWINVPLNRLPFKFRVPGSGFIHLIARVFDAAGQVSARDAKFFVDSACAQAGPPRIEARVIQKNWFAEDILAVQWKLTNTGKGAADYIEIDDVVTRTLAGSGTVGLAFPSRPPFFIGYLAPGDSTNIGLFFHVPKTVKRFSVTESGSLLDSFGRKLRFSINQSIIP